MGVLSVADLGEETIHLISMICLTLLAYSPAPVTTPPVQISGPVTNAITLRSNTSIAATTCMNGDRLIFTQDSVGNLRIMQSLSSSPAWNTTSLHYNFTAAKLGTPIAASCTEVIDRARFVVISLGQWVRKWRFCDSKQGVAHLRIEKLWQ